MPRPMDQWFSKETLSWVSIGSGMAFALGAIAVPWIVVNMPSDTFSRQRPSWLDHQPAAIRVPLRLLKNVVAVALVVVGIAMLVLPGQGIVAILLGVMLCDFPGKRILQRWILAKPTVLNSLNWLRQKFSKPPLDRPSKEFAT